MRKKSVALIPLRGGSKSIPLKNIKNINNKPLCYWVINEALKSNDFDKIIVSTDSKKIYDIVKNIDTNIMILDRDEYLATDTASTESVILDVMNKVDFDIITTIQATSPLTTKEDFISAHRKFESDKLDSLLTGVLTKKFFWNTNGQPLNYNPLKRPRRQDFNGSVIENGAFYITSRNILEKYSCRLGGKIGIHIMEENTLIEIDEPEDWYKVEELFVNREKKYLNNKLKNIKLLVMDVDGTLTDSGMYYSKEGDVLKKFNTKDGKGIELIRNLGIKTAFITGEKNEIVEARANKLKIDYLYMGITNKLDILKNICTELEISMDSVAYIGDDINDLDCIKEVGFSSCPTDSSEIIKNNSHYICKMSGGNAAVREICDLILASQKYEEVY